MEKKDFKYYWKIIKWPVLVLFLWNIALIITAKFAPGVYKEVFSTWPGLVVALLAYSFIGYVMVDEKKCACGDAAKAGAWAGGITGLVGAIIGILLVLWVPEIYTTTIQQAAEQGADQAFVEQMLLIGSIINLVLGPLVNGLIGAGVAALSGWITKKTSN